MSASLTGPRRVEIVLDIICAHSYIGYNRFARAASRFRAQGGELEVTFLPFQLDPDASDEGEPLLQVLERKFGPSAVDSTAKVAETAAADGIELRYGHVVHTQTFDAHRRIALAARAGRAEQLTERLFRAYFTDGVSVADPKVLDRLDAEAGLAPRKNDADEASDEVRAGLDRVRRLGVRSIPLFLFDDGSALNSAQSEETYFAALTADRSEDAPR